MIAPRTKTYRQLMMAESGRVSLYEGLVYSGTNLSHMHNNKNGCSRIYLDICAYKYIHMCIAVNVLEEMIIYLGFGGHGKTGVSEIGLERDNGRGKRCNCVLIKNEKQKQKIK